MNRWLYNDVRDTRISAGLMAVRLLAGVALMFHGWGKIQNPLGWMGPDAPVPAFFQALAAISEFGGGLALVLGLLTPLAALGVLFTMAYATFTHVSRGDPLVGKPGWEQAGTYFVIALLLLLAGPGRFSLDALLFRRSTRGSGTALP